MKNFNMLSSREQMKLVKALNKGTLEKLTFYPHWEEGIKVNIMVPHWVSVDCLESSGIYRERIDETND